MQKQTLGITLFNTATRDADAPIFGGFGRNPQSRRMGTYADLTSGFFNALMAGINVPTDTSAPTGA